MNECLLTGSEIDPPDVYIWVLSAGAGGTRKTIKQCACSNPERCRQPLDNGDGRVARPAFDVADIGAVDADLIRICFLAPAFLQPQAADVGTKASADVHAQTQTGVSTIDLQTISDMTVDWSEQQSDTAVTDE